MADHHFDVIEVELVGFEGSDGGRYKLDLAAESLDGDIFVLKDAVVDFSHGVAEADHYSSSTHLNYYFKSRDSLIIE